MVNQAQISEVGIKKKKKNRLIQFFFLFFFRKNLKSAHSPDLFFFFWEFGFGHKSHDLKFAAVFGRCIYVLVGYSTGQNGMR